MLDDLRFVQGAVAKKDHVQALTHFLIRGGRIVGYNGTLALSSPIDLAIDFAPKAVPFVKAISNCAEAAALSMTPAKRLAIKSGKFKAFIECVDETTFPEVGPEGERVELTAPILTTLKTLFPFIAEDASRPWARGILLAGRSAFVTNNIILIEKWLDVPFPFTVCIPRAAIVEIIRVGLEPVAISMTETSATFHFEGDRWLRTTLYENKWPDVNLLLGRECNPQPIPEGFFEAMPVIKPFVNENLQVFFHDGCVKTSLAEGEGAMVEVAGLPDGCFNIDQLQRLEPVVQTIDWSVKPALFYGEALRGVIIGMRT